MPTFHDPVADGEEARQALRGLARATRAMDDPSETYAVVGELLAGVRSLGQLDKLANAHLRHQLLARTDGDRTAGAVEAFAAADELRHAARLMERAGCDLNRASQHSGHRLPVCPVSVLGGGQ